MHEVTIGQMFLYFDAMGKYVIFTNPMGSGGSDDAAPAQHINSQEAAIRSAQMGILHPTKTIHVSEIDDPLIAAFVKGEDQDGNLRS